MSENEALFSVLRQSSNPACASAIEDAVREASDRDLCRVNPLAFAKRHGLDEECAIAAFLHASRLGIFELSWNVLCPGCGGVMRVIRNVPSAFDRARPRTSPFQCDTS